MTGIRQKIALFILLATSVVMLTGLSSGYFLGHRLLMDTIGDNHVKMAQNLAVSTASLIDRGVENIAVHATNPMHISAILESGEGYEGKSPSEINGYLMDMDEKWIDAGDESPLVREYMRGESAQRLKKYTLTDRSIAEIFTTNEFGGLAAVSGKTSDFYQADEEWWQKAYNDGKGALYIGDIEYDESAGLLAMTVAVPVKGEGGRVIGVMKALLRVDVFFAPLGDFGIGRTGHAVLTDEKGNVIFHRGIRPLSARMCGEREFDKIVNSPEGWGMLDSPHIHTGEKMFLAQAPVKDLFLSGAGIKWHVFVDEDAREAFSPVGKLIGQMSVVTLIMIALLVPISFLFGNVIAAPVKRLRDAVEHAGKGELDYPIEVETADEIGELAAAFKRMTATIKDKQEALNRSYLFLEEKVKERTLDLEKSQEATLHILEDLQAARGELEEKNRHLQDLLAKSAKSREVMVSMLDDNNRIRRDLEANLEELKKAQSMLVQSEKLASLGKLVSDMAHEVNNPLMIISGRAQLSKMDAGGNAELEENLRIIMDQCQRAKHIIQRLLSFSKPGLGEKKKVDINQDLEFITGMIEHQFFLRNIRIEKHFSPDIPPVAMDEKQMQEVFLNLLNNSAEAMPGGGEIEITTARDEDGASISIKDSGCGIRQEDLPRIFDPFFTTKKTGTGLGLSVCYGIVKAHGGGLEYTSEPGKGTTATVWLPLRTGESATMNDEQ